MDLWLVILILLSYISPYFAIHDEHRYRLNSAALDRIVHNLIVQKYDASEWYMDHQENAHLSIDNVKEKEKYNQFDGLQHSPFDSLKTALSTYAWLDSLLNSMCLTAIFEYDASNRHRNADVDHPKEKKKKTLAQIIHKNKQNTASAFRIFFRGTHWHKLNSDEMQQHFRTMYDEIATFDPPEPQFKMLHKLQYTPIFTTRYGKHKDALLRTNRQLSSLVLMSVEHRHCIVATMGTATFKDMATDARINLLTGQQHKGMAKEAHRELYNNVLPILEHYTYLAAFDRITFTGHSMGGALGLMMALDLQQKLDEYHRKWSVKVPKLEVVTFGQPAVYTTAAIEKRKDVLQKIKVVRIADKWDPFTLQSWLRHSGAGDALVMQQCKHNGARGIRPQCHLMEDTYIPFLETLPQNIGL